MLRLAGDGAGVAADAGFLVEEEAEAHEGDIVDGLRESVRCRVGMTYHA
jgi:hypothetical protein